MFRAVLAQREPGAFLQFYDYFELQPAADCGESASGADAWRDAGRRIAELGARLGVPVCACGNVYYQRPEDAPGREILHAASGEADCGDQGPLYFRSTEDMLAAFAYLGAETARRVVIDDPRAVAQSVEAVEFPERMPDDPACAAGLAERVLERMHALYGAEPPAQIAERTQQELTAVLGGGFAPYYDAAMTAADAAQGPIALHGGVASSLIAYFAGISDVNPLPPHERCPRCAHTQFAEGGVRCGADLPRRRCPVCGAELERDGFDLAPEVFEGLPGWEKLPHIELGLPVGEAVGALKKRYGPSRVFLGCEIETAARIDVQHWMGRWARAYTEKNGRYPAYELLEREIDACVGVKRRTVSSDGEYIVLPESVGCLEELCPAEGGGDAVSLTQLPWYELMGAVPVVRIREDPILPLLRALHAATGTDPETRPLDDPETLGLLSSGDAAVFAGLPLEEPERLAEVTAFLRPDCFGAFARAYGLALCHKTWIHFMRSLLDGGKAGPEALVVCREDVLRTLTAAGVDRKSAFTLMESARKGLIQRRGDSAKLEDTLRAYDLPDWYPDALRRAAYLPFGGAAVSGARNLFRCLWYKAHAPDQFSAAADALRRP